MKKNEWSKLLGIKLLLGPSTLIIVGALIPMDPRNYAPGIHRQEPIKINVTRMDGGDQQPMIMVQVT